jgi:HAD superfamily hydrolase (TIGR01490 family)
VNTLALFDLDGTLTCEDTMLAYIRQRTGAWKYAGMLLVAGALDGLGKIGVVPADAGKKRLMRMAFAGASVSEVTKDAERFAREAMPGLMRHGALERVRWHLREGHRVIVVSASCGAWLRPWCDAEEVELIATELETRDGHYTGELSTPNCKGTEKVRRLNEAVDLARYERMYAYGDTPADRPMLALATDPYYKPFHAVEGMEDRPEEECGAAARGGQALPPIGFLVVALILAGVGGISIHQALKPVTEAVATGSFDRVLEAFPRSGDWPDVIHFMPDHQVIMKDHNGTVRYEGRWRWDEKGHSLRLDDPVWDRRVAWVPGWGGPRLRVASSVGKDLFQTVTFRRAE